MGRGTSTGETVIDPRRRSLSDDTNQTERQHSERITRLIEECHLREVFKGGNGERGIAGDFSNTPSEQQRQMAAVKKYKADILARFDAIKQEKEQAKEALLNQYRNGSKQIELHEMSIDGWPSGNYEPIGVSSELMDELKLTAFNLVVEELGSTFSYADATALSERLEAKANQERAEAERENEQYRETKRAEAEKIGMPVILDSDLSRREDDEHAWYEGTRTYINADGTTFTEHVTLL